MQRRIPILVVGGAIVASAFGAFVWPTLYRYDHMGSTVVRIHRVTGQAFLLSREGWLPLSPVPAKPAAPPKPGPFDDLVPKP